MLSQLRAHAEALVEGPPAPSAVSAGVQFHFVDIDADPPGWDQTVRVAGQGMFHLSQLLAANASPLALRRGIVINQRGRSLGVVGALLYPGSGGDSLQTLSFPRLAPSDAARTMPLLLDWLAEQGVSRVRFGSYDGGVEPFAPTPGEGSLEERFEFPWRLDSSAAERMQRIRSNHKRKLKQLLKRNLSLREVQHLRPELMTWLRIRWAQRHSRRLGWQKILGLYRYYGQLNATLTHAGLAKLYGLYDERNRLLTIAYMLEAADSAFYMIGASAPAGYQVGASCRLVWDLAEHYAQRGMRQLNLGGVPRAAAADDHPEHGVYRFKCEFGIEPVPRATLLYQTKPEGKGSDGRTQSIAA